MGNYIFSSYEEPVVKSYCINSYADCNLAIERIEKNNGIDYANYRRDLFYKRHKNYPKFSRGWYSSKILW